MKDLLYKARGEHELAKKPRVYFTCHPADFARSFEKITEDILSLQNCVIYYTSDMTECEEDAYTDAVLGRMNLFVIPVSFRLLKEPCRAMQKDLAYAKAKNIAILPIMLDTGIDELYSCPDAFGERQYLAPYVKDKTGISYESKLEKYLSSVLIDEKTSQRVRDAFDAYVFLSYRKKDRVYADSLMRMIHKHREFRDIAIWYDEFLTPGESFRENIFRALERSEAFALLVTPHLLEEENFVMREEYPAAKQAKKPVLPMEMMPTDGDLLREKYPAIPDKVSPEKDSDFRARLLDTLARVAIRENDSDPEHNFLIGLAYLDGIDVEVDRERAVELITGAAEAGLHEAIENLYWMYSDGKGVPLDYRKAVLWAERHVEYHREHDGEDHPDTLVSLHNLAHIYGNLGDYENALSLNEKCYKARVRVLGEEHPDTLISLNNLASAYANLDDYKKARPLLEKCYEATVRVLGEEHPDTLASLNNLAVAYGKLGDDGKELSLNEKCYEMYVRVLGEDHPDTLSTLSNLAVSYGVLGDYGKALPLLKKCYEAYVRVLGEEHPDTLLSAYNLAYNYIALGDCENALSLYEKCYKARVCVLGEDHPDTLSTLNNLAVTYIKLGDYENAFSLHEKCYEVRVRILGEEHPATLSPLNNLAFCCDKLGDHLRAVELQEKLCFLRARVLGEDHEDTKRSKERLEKFRARCATP